MSEVIYLTGAPAAGKSSLTKSLRAIVDPLEVFEFGERLTAYLNRSRSEAHTQANLRAHSSSLATVEDINAVDEELIAFVDAKRTSSPVIIDSHPVTKEQYGFRVTAYALKDFERLRPTQIWVLFTDPQVTVDRIGADAQGRPAITLEEARFHTHLQASVATTYGMHLGIPVYFFDAAGPREQLITSLAARLSR